MGVIQIFIDQTVSAFKALFESFGTGSFDAIITAFAGVVWSPPLAILCLSAGLYFSCRMRFLQVRKIKKMVSLLFNGGSSDKGVSSFQAFALAVAGRVGTGNIVGVATAIAYGGPGALFWMWAIAFLGAGSAFVEATLAQLYKEEIDGEYRGGPAYYFGKRGLGKMGVVFMVATLLATAAFLPGIQSNAIVTVIDENFGIGTTIPMIIVLVLLALIILGGTKIISKSAEIIVPFMSGAYILVALIILAINFQEIPGTFALIFKSAFGLEQGLGGILGSTILWGVKRGVFSNEAGQGTAPHPAAAAEVSHPAKQGLVQAFSVYFDTLFVCSATGLAIIITKSYSVFQGGDAANGIMSGYGSGVFTSAEDISKFSPTAFNTLLTNFGGKFIAIALFFFAFTTLMAYYYYAETNLELMLKKYSEEIRNIAKWVLKVIYIAATFFFGVKSNAVAWAAADIGVGLMAWINIIGILIIAKPALLAFKDFERREKAGTDDEYFTVDSMPADEQAAFKGVTFWHSENVKDKQ